MHEKTLAQALAVLKSTEEGISSEEARSRLVKYGPNRLEELHKISPIQIFLEQFKDILVIILIFAAAVSALLGEMVDAVIIGIILVLNAALGFIQEYRAERAIEALKKLASQKATVVRNGKAMDVPSEELVPGDIILLETGKIVPADCRLMEEMNLEIQESALTGESTPVEKTTGRLGKTAQIADRTNITYAGTIVTKGKGRALVFATGMRTEIGKIAGIIQEAPEEKTPLQKNLAVLAKELGVGVLGIAAIVFAVGMLNGEASLIDMFIISVALAVAAVPEGLPAVVTVSLALGVQKMAQKSALVRRLPCIETLGCTTVICTDKTGTLTCNQMTVKKIYVDGKTLDVTGDGLGPGEIKGSAKDLALLLKTGALCNSSELETGDPTEIALIVSASKGGIDKKKAEAEEKKTGEIEFDSERKLMTTMHIRGRGQVEYTKGAPDMLLERCDRIIENGEIWKLNEKDKAKIMEKNREFASEALRVLGFAYKEYKGKAEEKNLIFIGLQAMIDPPRKDVKEAVARCKSAGIRVIMVTGDHKDTAVAIGKQIGITGEVLTGRELEEIKDLDKRIEETGIFSRVNPEHKVRIVEALKAKGHVVAMTGDGVNDAPALKRADIGIAMGRSGTDVAREASDIVLTDDNFASIVNAVEEGRGIYDNIKKFTYYLISSNLGEVFTIFIGIMMGLPLPLLAIQILWMNLVTDGLPALALGVEPKEEGIMQRRPRHPKSRIMEKRAMAFMATVGLLMAIGALGIFETYLPDISYARTMAFTTLILYEMFNAINAKTEEGSALKAIFSNKYMLIAIASSVALQALIIYTPVSSLFELTRLTLADWAYAAIVASSVLWLAEGVKMLSKKPLF